MIWRINDQSIHSTFIYLQKIQLEECTPKAYNKRKIKRIGDHYKNASGIQSSGGIDETLIATSDTLAIYKRGSLESVASNTDDTPNITHKCATVPLQD